MLLAIAAREDLEIKHVDIQCAFLNGELEEEVFVEKIMRFETGEIVEFTVENVLHWIQDDPLLVETIKELPAEEMQEKLFKCLLIYADRNEIYVHKNNASDK